MLLAGQLASFFVSIRLLCSIRCIDQGMLNVKKDKFLIDSFNGNGNVNCDTLPVHTRSSTLDAPGFSDSVSITSDPFGSPLNWYRCTLLRLIQPAVQWQGLSPVWLERWLTQYEAGTVRDSTFTEYQMYIQKYVSGDHIVVDVVQADAFFPTTFDTSRNLTGAIFSEQIKRKNRIYTRLEHHEYANGKEVIANRAFESASIESLGREIPLTDVPEWAAIAPDATIENIDRPLFAYFRIPKANREDQHSPLGVSVFADAVATIRDADRQYGALLWEYDGGQMAIDADDAAIRHNTNGSTSLPKREKRLFRHVLSGGAHAQQTLYEVFAPQLRDENYRRGLDTMLKRIEFQCGLAYGTLSDPQSVDKTAEEVRNSKQRSYSSVKSIQTALQAALDDLIYAINTYATMYQMAPVGEYKVAYDWDDSIVNDPAARKQMFWGMSRPGSSRCNAT